ncbi:glycosyltransferase family 2 protein [Streptomyces sp. DSM 42041]|uniref:Glycosyltransferase family 2 protein n=1 Tax=Streptomyces hazeniae TaxID=3075538 RepID=A0ABU2NM46_9ACTN|nr:glycosyltransferase family 2 protein [Streptomyces sp. DSM 42041]MDT0377303.1 glycosyltransferase family 2 protein [Streptomyces sp. DSM 42041]
MNGALATIGPYGIAVGAVLLIKLLLSIPLPHRQRRTAGPEFRERDEDLTLHAIVTAHNEPLAMLRRCLKSFLDQTRPPLSVTVVDDASGNRDGTPNHDAAHVCRELASAYRWAGVELHYVRHPQNRGKREGLATGFRKHWTADLYVCVDSDTVLEPAALEEAVRPFSRRRVHCVTGLVLAHNRAVNLLTRLIDMRYVNAFLGERVAYGRLGSVLCACGSLVVYRGWVVRKHLPDFLGQRFLGRPATFGDDRRLTYYCLIEGQSLINPRAVARTDVPKSLGHYVRQQIRWGKSFIREGVLLAAQFRHARRAFWWLNLLELAMWGVFTTALIAALVLLVTHPAGPAILGAYAAYVCVMSWLRSVHYLRGAASVPLGDRWATFACAPLYALLNLSLLLPLRLYSLATLRDNGWGTRTAGAEDTGHTTGEPLAAPVRPTTPANEDERPTLAIPSPRHEDTVPLVKLRDPDSETTLQVAQPLRTR